VGIQRDHYNVKILQPWAPLSRGRAAGVALIMALDDDITFFQQVPTFAALGREALQVLAIGAETRHLSTGAVLFYASEITDGAYLVQEGSLVLEPGTFSDNKEYIVGPGTLVGELALLTDKLSPTTAIAKEPTKVVRISRSLFRKTLEGYPQAAAKLQQIMAERLRVLTDELSGVRRMLDKT
jgi:CRP-like cAMP-binding protein